jgi:hypothetical protein
MEPHELDDYIVNKIREAEHAGGEVDVTGTGRVWSAIEPQLQTGISFSWIKIAALILLMLVPSVYLYLRNREQGRQLMTLSSKLTIIEKGYRQKLQAFAQNQPDHVVIQHDTVRLTRTVEKKIIPESVEIIRYVTDTVTVYQRPDNAENQAELVPAAPHADELNLNREESPAKAEYILAKDAPTHKKKKSRSFHISLGAGNSSPENEPELAFKTKL